VDGIDEEIIGWKFKYVIEKRCHGVFDVGERAMGNVEGEMKGFRRGRSISNLIEALLHFTTN
jgi:hypothetical protein